MEFIIYAHVDLFQYPNQRCSLVPHTPVTFMSSKPTRICWGFFPCQSAVYQAEVILLGLPGVSWKTSGPLDECAAAEVKLTSTVNTLFLEGITRMVCVSGVCSMLQAEGHFTSLCLQLCIQLCQLCQPFYWGISFYYFTCFLHHAAGLKHLTTQRWNETVNQGP